MLQVLGLAWFVQPSAWCLNYGLCLLVEISAPVLQLGFGRDDFIANGRLNLVCVFTRRVHDKLKFTLELLKTKHFQICMMY